MNRRFFLVSLSALVGVGPRLEVPASVVAPVLTPMMESLYEPRGVPLKFHRNVFVFQADEWSARLQPHERQFDPSRLPA